MKNTDIYFNLIGADKKLQTAKERGIDVGVISLNYQDTLTIHVGSGFGDATTSITDVSIFQWVNGVKGELVGSWPESSAFGDLGFSVSGTTVVVQDTDQRTVDDDYGYSVTVSAVKNGVATPYTADPQLQIKRKRPAGTAPVTTPSVDPEATP